jgi:acetylglutamate kinase
MSRNFHVMKWGGIESENEEFLQHFAAMAKSSTEQFVIVHGGGGAISALQKSMGIEPQFKEGLRVTNAKSMPLVEMVLCGSINKSIVRALNKEGLKTVGLSGADGNLLRAQALESGEEQSFVGQVVEVCAGVLVSLLSAGFVPVISPVAFDTEGRALNVNADHAAMHIALALGTSKLSFITSVAGVLDKHQQLISELNCESAQNFIEQGVLAGGMIPKVNSALFALEAGVPEVVIRGPRFECRGTSLVNRRPT